MKLNRIGNLLIRNSDIVCHLMLNYNQKIPFKLRAIFSDLSIPSMTISKLIFFVLINLIARNGYAQIPCTGLGQNPGGALPVCTGDTIIQETAPVCGGKAIIGPCSVGGTADINPYWYKITCFSAGSLGFTISPENAGDDYNWQLFDVTPYNPAAVYTDPGLFVACNWSTQTGNTGAGSAGIGLANCSGNQVPLFSSMPNLIQGHVYLLLISHFAGDSQNGYTLTFSGGSAIITDPVDPHLVASVASCNGTKISIKLSKKMNCNSVNNDGSDFILLSAVASITSALGVGCSDSLGTDLIELTLDSPLPPGNYKIMARPIDNLLDNCSRFIPSSDILAVTVFEPAPTAMDSLSSVACAAEVLELVFRDPLRCNSIAADGSDFLVTGSLPVSVIGAFGNCNTRGLVKIISVKLSAPIHRAGNFNIQLKIGADGNTIVNECGIESTAGAVLFFNTSDTVSALFKATVNYGCISNDILFSHDGLNGVKHWAWVFDNGITSFRKDTTVSYAASGQKHATLVVRNESCSDTASANIDVNNAVKASFEGTSTVCPGDPAQFVNRSTGSFTFTSSWNFGNGNFSSLQEPPLQFYPASNTTRNIPVQLIITNSIGCKDTVTHSIKVLSNCLIGIPGAFSPNGDGLNDYLYPINAYQSKNLLWMVFNRAGQKIFETHNWNNKWDGNFKGKRQDTGTYAWVLQYTNMETGQTVHSKGTSVLVR
jgi:gliding motility-associated-like protein